MLTNIKVLDYPIIYYGFYLYKNGKYIRSKKVFIKLLGKNPESAYLCFRVGMCFYKQGEWKEALHYFNLAKSKRGYQSQWDAQIVIAEKNLKNEVPNTNSSKEIYEKKPDSLLAIQQYSYDLYLSKSYWLAIHTIYEFIDRHPIADESLFNTLSLCYEALTNHQKAAYYLDRIIRDKKNNSQQHLYRYAYNLEYSGDFNTAQKIYSEIIENNSSEKKKLGIGWLHHKAEKWLDALNAYKQQIHQLENNNLKHSSLPHLYLKAAQVSSKLYSWKEATEFYVKHIETHGFASAHTYFKCAESFEKRQELESAAFYYEEAILRSNNYQDYWYYRLAYVLKKLGRIERANIIFHQSRKNTLPYGIAPNSVIKNKTQGFLATYTEYYEALPLKENFILFESFLGNSFSCNPYALLKHMLFMDQFKDFRFVVVLNDLSKLPNDLSDDRVICIKRQSDAYLRYLTTAKYLINNVSFPYYFIRKPEQIYLNTWHGTPLKTLGKDIKTPILDYANVARNFLHCTHIISQNKFTNDILLEKYNIKNMYAGLIAETGYPRVDLTLNLTSERRKEILSILKIDPKKPIVLYAPTWRGSSDHKSFDKHTLIKDLKFLQSNKYNLIFKAHHFAEEIIRKENIDIALVPSSIDSNELLGCADLLITDYSSIVFDFLTRNKPVISYIYDYDKYQDVRGLYINDNEFPGITCTNIFDVRTKVLAHLNQDFYDEKYTKYVEKEVGKSCERVINFVFNNDRKYLYSYLKKNTHLLFNGPYIPNGITRSFNNLLGNLSTSSAIKDNEFSVIVNLPDIKGHSDRLQMFTSNWKKSISYHARVGAMPMSLEEIWIREEFEKNFEFYSKEFKNKYLHMYKREARRLFGDTKFTSVINFEGYALFWVALLSQISSAKKVIYQHNDLYREWKTRFPYLQGVMNLYNNYQSIVSVSKMTMENNIKNLSELFNLDKDSFNYINNTILVEEILYLSNKSDILTPEFKKHNGPKILTIGRLSHEKDHDKLIRAFKNSDYAHHNAKLYIIGSGPLKEHLTSLIQELKLTNDVFLLGQLDNPYPYLKMADLFILPSNHEGQPMVLLEALVLDKDIVATDIVGNRGVLQGKYGTLVENSINGVLNGINLFLNRKLKSSAKFDALAYNKDAIAQFLNITKSNN